MNDTAEFGFRFAPTSTGAKSVWATVYTSLGSGRVRLTGEGLASGRVGLGEEALELKLYPNPARDILTISLDPVLLGSSNSIRISDINGVEMLRSAISGQNGVPMELDIRSLASGSYMLEL